MADALAEAIDLVGGQSQLARLLGIKQANVWHWLNRSGRVPAEYVLSIEQATDGKVSRHMLRPDLYPSPGENSGTEPQPADGLDAEGLRGQIYGLLAVLLTAPPNAARLQAIGGLKGGAGRVGEAIDALAAAALATDEASADREFHRLFIGMPRGELLPYASYYLTGFLHEKPLAKVRADLQRLGFERAPGVAEPEDHIGTLCEVMSALIGDGRGVDLSAQERFFRAHIANWADKFFRDLEQAQAARFYRPLGRLGRAFVELETQAFAMAA